MNPIAVSPMPPAAPLALLPLAVLRWFASTQPVAKPAAPNDEQMLRRNPMRIVE